MLDLVREKFKEVIMSVVPITIIVLILNFTIAPIGGELLSKFFIGAIFIVIGLAIFLLGIDLGITPIGDNIGHAIVRRRSLPFLIISGIILGFMINVAEPDLLILARQVFEVSSGVIGQWTLVVTVSIGIGIMMTIGLIRIVFKLSINKVLTLFYGVIFLLAIVSPESFLGIAFDSGGATTGSMTVPFILALGLGVASTQGGKQSEEDSFGLVGIASMGPMLAVLTMSIFSGIDSISGSLTESTLKETGVFESFIHEFPIVSKEVLMAMMPILILFLIFNTFYFKLNKRQFFRIMKGLLYAFLGFVFFLVGVNAGFMEAGNAIGESIVSNGNNIFVIITGFIIGFSVISAEPAVHVLNEQIEDVTSGHIRKKIILYTLAIGVASAVALSMIRILIPAIKLWHILVPGYIIAVTLSHFAPKIFIGIAFDSGGVASGPMTATFILAFAQGVASQAAGGDVLLDAFGVIGTVALTPLIAIQILGLIYERKAKKENDV